MSEIIINSRTITCCHECKDRHIGCHGTCERYKAERKALDEYNEQQRKVKDMERLGRPSKHVRRRKPR